MDEREMGSQPPVIILDHFSFTLTFVSWVGRGSFPTGVHKIWLTQEADDQLRPRLFVDNFWCSSHSYKQPSSRSLAWSLVDSPPGPRSLVGLWPLAGSPLSSLYLYRALSLSLSLSPLPPHLVRDEDERRPKVATALK